MCANDIKLRMILSTQLSSVLSEGLCSHIMAYVWDCRTGLSPLVVYYPPFQGCTSVSVLSVVLLIFVALPLTFVCS